MKQPHTRNHTCTVGLAVAFSTLLSACATLVASGPLIPASQFDETAFSNKMRPGTATLLGQGFMRTLGGDVKYAAGSEVRLMASTTYSDECVLLAQGRKGNEYLQCDPRLHQLTRKVTADAEGKFEFPNVSAGRYYVETQVYWTVPSQGLLFQNQGGPIGAYVDIRESETTKIILSR